MTLLLESQLLNRIARNRVICCAEFERESERFRDLCADCVWYQSHKWTVYVRGATNEDLGVVIKRAVFQLHSSFNNSMRVVECAPFQLSECGWGEFRIAITLFFHNDACEQPLNLVHHLRLYPDDDYVPLSTKKPVVVESYDEIVFQELSDAFVVHVKNHPAVNIPRLPSGLMLPSHASIDNEEKSKRGDTKDSPLVQWYTSFSEADELLKLAAAREQVQNHTAKLRRQLNLMDTQPSRLKPVVDQGFAIPQPQSSDYAKALLPNRLPDGYSMCLKAFGFYPFWQFRCFAHA
ncbi:Transcription initiation factor TFIID subunit 14b-like protein [Drosera capensis]